MRWDNSFHHLPTQTIPLIAAIFEFHRASWDSIIWHTGLYGAALLTLLEIPSKSIVIGKSIQAKNVLLPWYPHWNPLVVPAFKGVTNQLSQQLTQALLKQQLEISTTKLLKNVHMKVSIISPTGNSSSIATIDEVLQSGDRLIVYFSRRNHQARHVINEDLLIESIAKLVITGNHVIMIQSAGFISKETNIETLHSLWLPYARILSKAKVVIGPHGKLFFLFLYHFEA
jgi:hypothetical protein